MTILHVYFSLGNQKAFQQLLDVKAASAPTSTSARKSRSWTKSPPLASVDVNARDSSGRTVLHLACSSADRIEYVRSILRHPAVNVNLSDKESHWTPLHRALYSGNLQAALLLLQRPDIDTSLKDYEGYTPFDLYNSTVEGTTPQPSSEAELYTWGTNRNATLGLGDADDRTLPELVPITPMDSPEKLLDMSIAARFSPIHVRQLEMSRLHTAVVTSESYGNVRVSGFGSGGRLGPVQHTQYSLTPISITGSIVSVALGQDHTLALTNSGEVYSWGLNRFSQLGYVVECTSGVPFGRIEEPIQSSPKKIYGSLKKEFVRGVIASKMSSACWTATEVFSWGTNNGQLGYDKAAQPVQIFPRKVTKITKPVISMALTDSAMACLLETGDVICIWNDRSFKINFPSHGFPSEIQPYRPPQASKTTNIAKIVCSGDLFAALSSNGELFTFSLPATVDSESAAGKSFKPQRVWALRKQFSAVQDVAIGSEGSIIVCTKSGHVFVRSRTTSSAKFSTSSTATGKAFKFQRVPFLQRVVKVSANSTGAFGALRVDHKLPKIVVTGNSMAQDFALIRPYLKRPSLSDDARVLSELIDSSSGITGTHKASESEADDEDHDPSITHDFQALLQLCSILNYVKESRKNDSSPLANHFFHGADLIAGVGHNIYAFPAHSVILAARSAVLQKIMCDTKDAKVVKDPDSNIVIRFLPCEASTPNRLRFTGCHPMSVLIFLDYIYTDKVLAIWDNRLSMLLSTALSAQNTTSSKIKEELRVFAHLLCLSSLTSVLSSATKLVPHPTLSRDMSDLHTRAQISSVFKLFPSPDTILCLADKDVHCYSVVLRSRSSFFASFFDDPDWTRNRRNQEGVLVVNLKHLKWHVMEYVLRFLCCGEDKEMFDKLDFVNSVDDVLDFVSEVLAAADELLLDRLVLLCSEVILQFSDIGNICSVLTEATHFHALPLVGSVQAYMAANMETLLESRMLDMLSPGLIKQLSLFIQTKQQEKAPVTRFCLLAERAMATFGDWLSLQDIPQPIMPPNRTPLLRDSPKLSPSDTSPRQTRRSVVSSPHHGSVNPAASSSQDDIFVMDDIETSPEPLMVWKATSTPTKIDMRVVMAEAANASEQKVAGPIRPTKAGYDVFDAFKVQSKRSVRPDGFVESSSPSRVSSSPWKAKAQPEPPTSSSVKGTAFPKLSASTLPRQKSQPKPINVPTPSATSQPTPVVVRRASSGKAWTTPVTASPTIGVSFATIQQEQLEATIPTVREKQSLLEIQKQEEDRRTEEEFLNWWAAEEERTRTETNAAAVAPKRRPKRRPARRHNVKES